MKILVVRLSAIGDCTLVLPVIRAILEQQPESEVTWLIGKGAYQLLKDCTHPRLTFVPIDKPRSFKDYRAIKKQLAKKFDVLLAMQASTRANLIYPLIKAKRKIGFDKTRARELQWLFTTEQIEFKYEHLHDSFCQFANKLEVKTDDLDWSLQLIEGTESFNLSDRYLVINPAASKLERSWFAKDYAQVIDYCYKNYQLVTVLTGGSAEFELELAAEVESLSNNKPINLVGRTSLQQLAAVLRKAEFCVAPDTGPAHIANAVGTPVIGLYAIAPSRLSGPYLNQELTIDRFTQAVEIFLSKDLEELPWRTRVHDRRAMGLIKVADVTTKITRLLSSQG